MNYKLVLENAVIVFQQVLVFLILIRVVLSWLRLRQDNVFIRLVMVLTEPILAPIRNIIKKSPLGSPGMMLDFSPIIAWLLINLLCRIILSLIRQL